MMRKEAVILTGGLALIGAYLYFSQGEGEKSKGDNQFLTGGGYIPKKMIPVEPPVEPSSNITYNIQFPEPLNIPQYTPSFTSFTSEPSPKTKKSKSKTSRDIPVSPSTGSPIMMDMLSPPPPPSPTDALKKKDINIPPPPGLTMVSSMADALTKGLGSITGALKKKELKKSLYIPLLMSTITPSTIPLKKKD